MTNYAYHIYRYDKLGRRRYMAIEFTQEKAIQYIKNRKAAYYSHRHLARWAIMRSDGEFVYDER